MSINASIGITPAAIGRPARLRADGIQTAALVQLGRILAEGDDGARRLVDALEYLGTVANGTAREGELEAALDDVAALGHLDTAHVDLSAGDVRQLATEAAHAVNEVAAGLGTVHALPVQSNRRAS